MKLIKSKKGGIFDLILAIALSFLLIICLVLFTFAQNQVETKLLELAPTIQDSFDNNTNVTKIIEDSVGKVSDAFDSFKWISIMLIFGFFMSILVSAFLVKSHPAWFIGYIFVVMISVLISVYIANTYETLMYDPILSETFLTGFFGANWIFLNLPVWVTIIGFIAGILMYINLDTGGYYG